MSFLLIMALNTFFSIHRSYVSACMLLLLCGIVIILITYGFKQKNIDKSHKCCYSICVLYLVFAAITYLLCQMGGKLQPTAIMRLAFIIL